MTLRQLRYLVAIADSCLNITQAASRVHATQSGISKQLKQLEDELGFAVFLRRGKSLARITRQGAHVIERARVILEQAADIRAFAASERRDADRTLRIVTTHTQARFVLPAAIAALRRRHPHAEVRIAPVGDDAVLAQLAADDADFALVSRAGCTPPAGRSIALYRWNRVVLVPRSHALARLDRPLRLADLARHPLLTYDSALQDASTLRRAFVEAGLEPRLAVTARDADVIKAHVRQGLGVGILAEMAVLETDADLVVLAADGVLPACTTWLVTRADRPCGDFAFDLIALLARCDRQRLREHFESPAASKMAEAVPPHWRDGEFATLAA